MSGDLFSLSIFAHMPTAGHWNHIYQKLTHFCPCDVKSYEALFTALSEPSVSPGGPMALNKVASQTMYVVGVVVKLNWPRF